MPQASIQHFHLQISKLPISQIYDFSCVCRNKDVCRIQMNYGDHVVSMPNEKNKFYLYCQNLGFPRKDPEIDILWERHIAIGSKALQVSTKHFNPADVTNQGTLTEKATSLRSNDFAIVGDKQKWQSSHVPAATVAMLKSDTRYLNDGITRSSSTTLNTPPASTISSRSSSRAKRREEQGYDRIEALTEACSSTTSTSKQFKSSNYNYKTHATPRKFSMVCDVYNLVEGYLEIDYHAGCCGSGELLHSSRQDVSYHGLCGTIRFRCKKGKRCMRWMNGELNIHTQSPVSTVDFAKSRGVTEEEPATTK